MVLQDRLEKEKGFAKNAVESYVYDMRGRLYDKLQKYITEEVTYCVMLTVDRNPCSFEHYQIVISPIILVVSISERFSIECSKANTLSKCNHNHNGQSEEGKIPL